MTKKKPNNAVLMIGIAAAILLLLNKDDKPQKKPSGTRSGSGSKESPTEFLKRLKPYAIALGNKIGVPYLFILSQIALETAFGRSELFYKHFNVGGIKAVKGQSGVNYLTWEYVKDRSKYPDRDKSKDLYDAKKGLWKIRTPQKFAVYKDLPSGLIGYSGILLNRYFKKYANKTKDAKQYAAMLQSGKPKYATDINYLPKIYKLIDAAKLVA